MNWDKSSLVFLLLLVFALIRISTSADDVSRALGATQLIIALAVLNLFRRYGRWHGVKAAIKRNRMRETTYWGIILASMLTGLIVGPWGMFAGALVGWLVAESIGFAFLPMR